MLSIEDSHEAVAERNGFGISKEKCSRCGSAYPCLAVQLVDKLRTIETIGVSGIENAREDPNFATIFGGHILETLESNADKIIRFEVN